MAAPPEPKPVTPPAPKRERSPNYPAISFTEALGYAETIWKLDKRNPVSPDMASKHLGYKAKNGASLPILGSLRRYGLMLGLGDKLRISDEANTIFIAPHDQPERIELIQKLAMRPALFGEVLKRFPDGLPSDGNLRFRLRQDFGFANDKAADNFIKSLKDAVRLSSVAPVEETADTEVEESEEEAAPMTPEPTIIKAQTGQNQPKPPPTPAPGNPYARTWDIGGGSVVSVMLPAKLTKGNIEKLKKYISALELEASISWEDDDTQ